MLLRDNTDPSQATSAGVVSCVNSFQFGGKWSIAPTAEVSAVPVTVWSLQETTYADPSNELPTLDDKYG